MKDWTVEDGTDTYITYKIFVYHRDWPQKPFSMESVARNITEAVDKLVRALDEDTFLCPANDGGIWYYEKPIVEVK